MYSPHRLDTPPPPSNFRRPWSPQEFDSYSRTRPQRREASDASFEALDLADYATTLHRTNMQSLLREPGPYPPFAPQQDRQYHEYPEYPATPPRSYSLASAPSLVSSASTSAQSHSRSPNLRTPTRRPFSLPSPYLPHSPLGSNSGHSHNYPRIFEHQSQAQLAQAEVDIASFPEWSRDWYDRPKPHTNAMFDPYGPYPYDPDFATQSHENHGFPTKAYSSTNDSHRSLLPWSGEDGSGTHVTSEMKEERLRMLEKEFGQLGPQAMGDSEQKVIGSVDAKGNIITDGPKKRAITRWVQGTFALGAAIASLYSALILKPQGNPPPKGTIPAYLLYLLSVITVLLLLYMFLFRPCCCAGKRRQKMAQEGPAGMMVLPVQGLPGSGAKKKQKGKGKKGKNGEHGGEGVQVNLIVDPSAFGGFGGAQEDDEGTDGDADGAPQPRRGGRRRGLFEGLAMEHQWKLARRHLKQLLGFDIVLFFLWGAEFIVILMGKRCPVGSFDGWCDGYNVATALASLLTVTFGLSVFFDIKDLHMSRVSPRTRT